MVNKKFRKKKNNGLRRLFLVFVGLIMTCFMSFLCLHMLDDDHHHHHQGRDNPMKIFWMDHQLQINNIPSSFQGSLQRESTTTTRKKDDGTDKVITSSLFPFSEVQYKPSDLSAYETLAKKSSYDPEQYPIISNIPVPPKKLKVRLLAPKRLSGKFGHLFLDGLNRSDYIDLVDITELPSNTSYTDLGEELWIDAAYFSGCEYTIEYAKQRSTTTKTPIKILMLDYQDYPKLTHCDGLQDVIGRENIRYIKRSLATNRHWNFDTEWIEFGYLSLNYNIGSGTTNSSEFFHGPIRHGAFAIRTDQVQSIRDRFDGLSPLDHEKKHDVTHIWGFAVDPFSRFRNKITTVLRSMDKMELNDITNGSTPRQLKVFANYIGKRSREGRNSVQTAYIGAMLKSKIVVVSQRDEWEGHYRLMEAMACGAMVIHDFMLGLPKGSVEGVHLELFRTEEELRTKIIYYATHDEERKQMAKNGWEIAMGRHRSWHRMEELIFGRPLTDVDNPYESYQRIPRNP